jgi:N-acetyl-gamma-glutamylphosphate reductase
MKVAVIGAAGYAGGELLRLLLQHPDVAECVATSRSQAGKPVGGTHPGLASVWDARFSGATPGEAARGRDVVFLCLEHGESSRVAGEVFDAGPGLVVDLAADFRVRDLALYQRHYGPHTAPDLLPRFTYGLADVVGCGLRGASAIAAPGIVLSQATSAIMASSPAVSNNAAGAGTDWASSITNTDGRSAASWSARWTTPSPPSPLAGAIAMNLRGSQCAHSPSSVDLP